MSHVKVVVKLKPSLLDAQGRVVQDALHSMGYGEVDGVRIGKYLELEVTPRTGEDHGAMETRVREMCDRLLANPVIENYSFEVTE
jgi:phosphoribosylformylglycinamidine synthase